MSEGWPNREANRLSAPRDKSEKFAESGEASALSGSPSSVQGPRHARVFSRLQIVAKHQKPSGGVGFEPTSNSTPLPVFKFGRQLFTSVQ
jgi:hypothetical protein